MSNSVTNDGCHLLRCKRGQAAYHLGAGLVDYNVIVSRNEILKTIVFCVVTYPDHIVFPLFVWLMPQHI